MGLDLGDGEVGSSLLGGLCAGFCCSSGMGIWLHQPLKKEITCEGFLFENGGNQAKVDCTDQWRNGRKG